MPKTETYAPPERPEGVTLKAPFRIIGSKGQTLAEITEDVNGGAVLFLYAPAGHAGVSLGAAEIGGGVSLADAAGVGAVVLTGCGDHGGVVSVRNNAGADHVILAAGEVGGQVAACGPKGIAVACLFGTPDGGVAGVFDKDGLPTEAHAAPPEPAPNGRVAN